MEERLEQPENVDSSMLTMLLLRLMEESLEHFWNACFPMLVTLLGMVMDLRLEQL